MKAIAILGSTGSIGRSALSVVDAHPDRLRVVALAGGENAASLAEQIRKYRPAIVGVASQTALDELRRHVGPRTATRLVAGADGLLAVAPPARRRSCSAPPRHRRTRGVLAASTPSRPSPSPQGSAVMAGA